MEIIVEIVLQVFGWIVQFLAELLVQLVGEVLVELFGHSIKEPFRRPKPVSPWLAALGYAIFGAAAGAASLWLLPALFITSPTLRLFNLMLTPLVAGLVMSQLGAWRQRRDQEIIGLDKFAYGFCFALSMGIVRYVWAV